ncbi:hypothetical protein Q8G50_34575, partial [Klebsiella pneumoniae]
FVSRTYTVHNDGKPIGSGTQIIGWDPVVNQIASWTFHSQGGFSHELWIRQGAEWAISAEGVLSDGRTSQATNVLVKL